MKIKNQKTMAASANYRPDGYRVKLSRSMRLHSLRRKCRKIIKEATAVDDQCYGIFDPAIEAVIEGARNDAAVQYNKHIRKICENKNRMYEEREMAKTYLRYLEKEKEELDSRYAELKNKINKRRG
ncbi:MAG: hypothetical protein LUE19_04185 [Clostridiales bacterium]|nr:hypothetical protein [Clostridiales bacterium]